MDRLHELSKRNSATSKLLEVCRRSGATSGSEGQVAVENELSLV